MEPIDNKISNNEDTLYTTSSNEDNNSVQDVRFLSLYNFAVLFSSLLCFILIGIPTFIVLAILFRNKIALLILNRIRVYNIL